VVRDEEDYARHIDYIHYNPVKHGHVARVRDWAHSSFHRYVRNGELPPDWGGTQETRDGSDCARYGEL
jgi:putative transposase